MVGELVGTIEKHLSVSQKDGENEVKFHDG